MYANAIFRPAIVTQVIIKVAILGIALRSLFIFFFLVKRHTK